MACLSELRKTDDEYFEIQAALKYIFTFCRDRGVDEGEAQQLIRIQFGKLELIDSTRFPEIKTWFNHNWHRKTQILEPAYHEVLMRSNDMGYANWFINEEKKNNPATTFTGQE
jgi:hypothetical protein